MPISTELAALNAELLERDASYGASAVKHIDYIKNNFIDVRGVTDILDYGCGQNQFSVELLKTAPAVKVTPYDPSVPEFSERPKNKFETIFCYDVLQAVEPELIDGVLQDILSLGEKYFYFSITIGPSGKQLSDGRDPNLTQQPKQWWHAKLIANGFELLESNYRQVKDGTERKYTLTCLYSKLGAPKSPEGITP
jgi:SAM-dependent methyltransferase